MQQAGKTGEFLRVSLPKSSQPDDRLVFVLVADKEVKNPASLILMPEGNIDDAIKSMRDIVKRLGEASLVIHQQNRFNNGIFNCCSQPNSNKQRGMFAWCTVGKGMTPKGVCITYFNASDWAANKKGEVELPLPSPAAGVREEPIPKTCELSVWLVTKGGLKVAEGNIKVVRE